MQIRTVMFVNEIKPARWRNGGFESRHFSPEDPLLRLPRLTLRRAMWDSPIIAAADPFELSAEFLLTFLSSPILLSAFIRSVRLLHVAWKNP